MVPLVPTDVDHMTAALLRIMHVCHVHVFSLQLTLILVV